MVYVKFRGKYPFSRTASVVPFGPLWPRGFRPVRDPSRGRMGGFVPPENRVYGWSRPWFRDRKPIGGMSPPEAVWLGFGAKAGNLPAHRRGRSIEASGHLTHRR